MHRKGPPEPDDIQNKKEPDAHTPDTLEAELEKRMGDPMSDSEEQGEDDEIKDEGAHRRKGEEQEEKATQEPNRTQKGKKDNETKDDKTRQELEARKVQKETGPIAERERDVWGNIGLT